MAKHRLPGLTDELMKKGKHFILIRNPLQIMVCAGNILFCFYGVV